MTTSVEMGIGNTSATVQVEFPQALEWWCTCLGKDVTEIRKAWLLLLVEEIATKRGSWPADTQSLIRDVIAGSKLRDWQQEFIDGIEAAIEAGLVHEVTDTDLIVGAIKELKTAIERPKQQVTKVTKSKDGSLTVYKAETASG